MTLAGSAIPFSREMVTSACQFSTLMPVTVPTGTSFTITGELRVSVVTFGIWMSTCQEPSPVPTAPGMDTEFRPSHSQPLTPSTATRLIAAPARRIRRRLIIVHLRE